MSKVLVTDGRSRASLAIIRALGKKGINVTVGEAFSCPSFYSKYTSERLIYPPPDKQPSLFIERLLTLVQKDDYDAIITVRDDATLLLSKNRDLFSRHVNFAVVDFESFCIGRDKSETIRIALSNGVPCPKTYFPAKPDDLIQLKGESDYPLLIKPNKSSGSRGIKVVNSYEELVAEYYKVYSTYGPALVQEFIPYGGAYGVSALFNKGEPRAVFAHKRLRQYPESGGPSTLRESVHYPEIEEYAIRLLKKLNWHGVAMVEFRIDARTNEPKLMEINPRFWGSLQLAIHSGVNFPYLLYELAINGDVEPVFEYEVGKKVRWLLPGDILWFLSTPNKLKSLPEFLKFRGMGYDIISSDDPVPALSYIFYSIKSLAMKERRTHVFKRGWTRKQVKKQEGE